MGDFMNKIIKVLLTVMLVLFGSAISFAQTQAPVDFKYVGLTPDKKSYQYQIKINSDKPISQVDVGEKRFDASGKVVDDTTFAWQNIITSHKQPIEKGKTYTVNEDLNDFQVKNATNAEAKLLRVHFVDGTTWSAPK